MESEHKRATGLDDSISKEKKKKKQPKKLRGILMPKSLQGMSSSVAFYPPSLNVETS